MTSPHDSHPHFATNGEDAIEVLSAYLDGETDGEENQRIKEWLHGDPQARHRFQQMQVLRQGMRSLPIPAPTQSPEGVANAIFAKTEARRRGAWVWGSTAVAAAFVATVSVMLPTRFETPEVARSPQPPSILPTRVSPVPEAAQISPTRTEREIVQQALFVE